MMRKSPKTTDSKMFLGLELPRKERKIKLATPRSLDCLPEKTTRTISRKKSTWLKISTIS